MRLVSTQVVRLTLMMLRKCMKGETVVAFPPAVADACIAFDNKSGDVHLFKASCDLQPDLTSTDYDNPIKLQD